MCQEVKTFNANTSQDLLAPLRGHHLQRQQQQQQQQQMNELSNRTPFKKRFFHLYFDS
jgi:hypothetical protein